MLGSLDSPAMLNRPLQPIDHEIKAEISIARSSDSTPAPSC
jgi:hypothetical protein